MFWKFFVGDIYIKIGVSILGNLGEILIEFNSGINFKREVDVYF